MSETVYDRRRNVVSHLQRNLGGDAIVVAAPDHPLVMRSVDVLVGSPSGLTAIVFSTAEERQRPNVLWARVALNKMALPPDTRFVYVIAENEKQPSVSFSAFLDSTDSRSNQELVTIASSPKRLPRHDGVEKLQRLSEQRFADTYRLVRILQRRRTKMEHYAGAKSSRAPKRDFLAGGIEGAFFDFEPTSQAIVRLSVDGAERWFEKGEYEPQPTDSPAGVAFAMDYPLTPGDPDKVLRAGAFSGWIFAPSDSSRTPNEIAELAAKFARLR